jgi:hypothetical protein
MGAENGDQLGWDGHPAGSIRSTVLQPALIVGRVVIAPALGDLGTGLLQGQPPPSGRKQVAVLPLTRAWQL